MRHLELEHGGEARDEPEGQRATVHVLVVRAGGPVLDSGVHPGGESGRVEEPMGAGGFLDLFGFAL
jgi:hypothetical protein